MKKRVGNKIYCKFVLLIIFIMFFSIIDAQPPFAQPQNLLGGYEIKIPPFDIFQQNKNVNLNFHLFNLSNGVPIDNSSTDCFLHLYKSNGDQILDIEVPHESFQTINNEWEILILGNNFSEVGDYGYIIQCNSTSLGGFESISFSITPSGKDIEIGESIIYFILVLILIGLDLLILFLIFVLPSKNNQDDSSKSFQLIKLKYLRVVLIGIMYPMIIVTLNFVNGLAVNFTSLTMFAGVIGFLFETLLRGAWIYTVIIIIWIVIMLIKDTNWNNLMEKHGYFGG